MANKFVNAFKKITAPAAASVEELKAFTRKINVAFEDVYAKIYGYIEMTDLGKSVLKAINSKAESADLQKYSTITQTEDLIQSAVVDLNLDQYSTITQTSDAIAVAVADKADASALASLEAQFADAILNGASMDDLSAIAAQFNDALGDKASISFVNLTANNLSSLIADKASVSYVNQTSSSLSSSISNVSGRVSVLEQTDSSVAIKLKNPAINGNFEARIGNPQMGGSIAGLEFLLNGLGSPYGAIGLAYASGLLDDRLGIWGKTDLEIAANGKLWLSAGLNNTVDLILQYDSRKGAMSAVLAGHMLPSTGQAWDLGGNGDGMRWRTVYANNSLNVSDLRYKRDVAPLNAAWLLDKLRPIRYRLTESEERDGKIRFGFGVQPIQAAIAGTDIEGANLIDTSNPDRYNMSYTDLIAVLVEGYQQQQQEINALKRAMGGAA